MRAAALACKLLLDNRVGRPAAQRAMRVLAANPATRAFVNRGYRWLSDAQLAYCHALFAHIFEHSERQGAPGTWPITFLGRRILLPLRKETFWLDWGLSLATLGHDSDVKQTYRTLLQSLRRPDLFIDVGANYGTHSVLFLGSGVETISVAWLIWKLSPP
jgi:hypothetical protein